MKLTKGLKLNKITGILKKIPFLIEKRGFLFFLILLILFLLLGSLIFYKYCFSVKKEKSEVKDGEVIFKEKSYQSILETVQKKEKQFQEAGLKQYPDMFYKGGGGTVVIPLEPPSEPQEQQESEEEKKTELSAEEIEKLLKASNLYEFYLIKEKGLPSISQRAKVWEEKGLGSSQEYSGLDYQNIRLLEALKKELTQ